MTRNRPQRARWAAVVVTAFVLGLQIVLGSPAAVAAPFDCANPPAPESINGGLTGAIDPSIGNGMAGTIYADFGYAGQVWHTYDTGDRWNLCTDGTATISTWTGNQLFSAAKVVVASVNSLHYLIYEGGLADTLDGLVEQGASAAFQGFAVPFLGLALLIIGIAAFRYVFAGNTSGAAYAGARVVLGLVLIGATAFSPMLYSKFFDSVLVEGVKEAQSSVDEVLYDEDRVVLRHVLPETLHHNIVWTNWARGEFGDPHSDLAGELGGRLVAAQACSWAETRNDTCDPQAKQEDFQKIAEQVKNEGDYGAFTGANGGRVGSGALALFESLIFGLLQLAAKLGVLLAQLVMRVFVLFGPIIGILAMAPGVGRTVLRGVLGVGVLGLIFNVTAAVHTFLLVKILDSDLPLLGQLTVMTLLTMLVWSVARPFKRLRAMMASSMYSVPGQGAQRVGQWLQHAHMTRLMRRAGNRNRRRGFDKEFWLGKTDPAVPPAWGVADDDTPGTVWAHASRPESAPQRPAMAAAAASSATAALPPGRRTTTSGTPGADTGDSAAGPPPPPRNPGGSPAGHGAAATPIRAEATRLWESDGSAYSGRETPERRPITETRRALPAAQWQSPAAADEIDTTDQAPPDRRDLVTPTEIYRDEDHPAEPHREVREAEPRQEQGQTVYQVYTPSEDRVIDRPVRRRDEKSGQRPEVQPDHMTRSSTPDDSTAEEYPDADSH